MGAKSDIPDDFADIVKNLFLSSTKTLEASKNITKQLNQLSQKMDEELNKLPRHDK